MSCCRDYAGVAFLSNMRVSLFLFLQAKHSIRTYASLVRTPTSFFSYGRQASIMMMIFLLLHIATTLHWPRSGWCIVVRTSLALGDNRRALMMMIMTSMLRCLQRGTCQEACPRIANEDDYLYTMEQPQEAVGTYRIRR